MTLLAAAETSWPEAGIAIAGIALVGSIVCIVVWQALATMRTRMEQGARDRSDNTR